MRIRWTPAAAADLQSISDYLKEHHPRYRDPTMQAVRDYPRVETMAGTWPTRTRSRNPRDFISARALCSGVPRERADHRSHADLSHCTGPALVPPFPCPHLVPKWVLCATTSYDCFSNTAVYLPFTPFGFRPEPVTVVVLPSGETVTRSWPLSFPAFINLGSAVRSLIFRTEIMSATGEPVRGAGVPSSLAA